MRMSLRSIVVGLPVLAACATAGPTHYPTFAPELDKRVVAEHGVVSSAHPRASEAGVEMLRRGGNAVDAAVATAFAVSVGEPQMSGVGGGGGMLIWLQDEGRVEYVDFYAAQRAETFRGVGAPDSGAVNLRIVGIPGEVAGLLEAHERFGRLPRATVLEPAIRLAEEGFAVNQVLAEMIASAEEKLSRFPDARRDFFPGGRPLQPGDLLRQPELAATLRTIAAEGRAGFYESEVARQVVEVLNRGGHPARLSDFAEYAPQWKRPLCGEYRGWVVLSAPPPQTGMQIIHTLELLEGFDLAALGLPTRSAEAFDLLTSALRVGAADGRYNSDPNWATVPAAGVTSPGFAAERRALVGTGRAAEKIEPGKDPLRFDAAPPAPACERYEPYGPARPVALGAVTAARPVDEAAFAGGETTHLSVVDAEGNAVALTQTNSSAFGSGARVAGFFLNDSGFDFSRSGREGAGRSPWRIRNSTISPTIVLRDGRVQMVIGAPGAGRIPPAIIQSMVYILDYGLDPLEALRMPRVYPSAAGPRVETENGFDAEVLGRARAMGYLPTADAAGYARVYVIARRGDRWVGAADPRHNGGARGY